MTKLLRGVVSLAFITICICGGSLTFFTPVAQASSKISLQQPMLNGYTTPKWALQATPYVHVVNYVASIDPTISYHLSDSDVATVRSSVAYYNALSLTVRKFHGTVSLPIQALHTHVAPLASCDFSIHIVGVSWFGAVTVHLGYCLALELAGNETISTVIAAYIGGIFPPALPIVGFIGLYMGIEAVALGTFASQCGDGAYFNFLLWNPGVFWPSRDC